MKSHVCVLTLDASRARLFGLEVQRGPGGESLTKLVEVEDLANPGRRQRASEAFTDSRPGMHGGAGGGPGHGLDDGRDAHLDELERRFTVDVVAALGRQVQALGASRAVIAASPRMLGHLRETIGGQSKLGVEIDELGKELTKLSPVELHDHLAKDELLPPRGRLTR
ncbi:host attachment protein [Haliangium sp.]|uniref:host attachment protein n=1 Tax=Haliangium sp. TaxID=2663208 RepID=UPI003D105206